MQKDPLTHGSAIDIKLGEIVKAIITPIPNVAGKTN
jgi:hypothetical protein